MIVTSCFKYTLILVAGGEGHDGCGIQYMGAPAQSRVTPLLSIWIGGQVTVVVSVHVLVTGSQVPIPFDTQSPPVGSSLIKYVEVPVCIQTWVAGEGIACVQV